MSSQIKISLQFPKSIYRIFVANKNITRNYGVNIKSRIQEVYSNDMCRVVYCEKHSRTIVLVIIQRIILNTKMIREKYFPTVNLTNLLPDFLLLDLGPCPHQSCHHQNSPLPPEPLVCYMTTSEIYKDWPVTQTSCSVTHPPPKLCTQIFWTWLAIKNIHLIMKSNVQWIQNFFKGIQIIQID